MLLFQELSSCCRQLLTNFLEEFFITRKFGVKAIQSVSYHWRIDVKTHVLKSCIYPNLVSKAQLVPNIFLELIFNIFRPNFAFHIIVVFDKLCFVYKFLSCIKSSPLAFIELLVLNAWIVNAIYLVDSYFREVDKGIAHLSIVQPVAMNASLLGFTLGWDDAA